MTSARRTFTLSLPLFLLLTSAFASGSYAQNAGVAARRAKLRAALDEEWQYTLRTSPEMATGIGDPRYNDRWSDYSAAEQVRQVAHARAGIRVFEAIHTA